MYPIVVMTMVRNQCSVVDVVSSVNRSKDSESQKNELGGDQLRLSQIELPLPQIESRTNHS
jgi:hypothetical protein